MKIHNDLPYDKHDPTSIETYAKNLIDKTFREVINEAPSDKVVEKITKGSFGHILEEYYFQYKINSDSRPDFPEAGVELKVSGYVRNKSGKKRAKERLVMNIINFLEIVHEKFDDSSFLRKNATLLLIFYHYLYDMDQLDYPIHYAQLFQYPEKDLKIIRDDWNTIVRKVREGKAHEISEADTNYLGACTKGASSLSVREQPYSDIMAKQRAFSLKSSYLTHILNEYVIKGKVTYSDSIIKNPEVLDEVTFEELILKKIESNKGKTLKELAIEYMVTTNPKGKSFTADIAKAMLGVKGEHIEEFEKANIKIKTIRIGKNGKIREHMSFPAFRFMDLVQEEWETSNLRQMFLETRYLFVVYRFDENEDLRLDGAMFWNVPYDDLEGEIRRVWERTRKVVSEGIIERKVGKRTLTNLPGSGESEILHVRPHARNRKDTYPLPNEENYTKQSFWLNNSYILKQIMERKGNDANEE